MEKDKTSKSVCGSWSWLLVSFLLTAVGVVVVFLREYRPIHLGVEIFGSVGLIFGAFGLLFFYSCRKSSFTKEEALTRSLGAWRLKILLFLGFVLMFAGVVFVVIYPRVFAHTYSNVEVISSGKVIERFKVAKVYRHINGFVAVEGEDGQMMFVNPSFLKKGEANITMGWVEK